MPDHRSHFLLHLLSLHFVHLTRSEQNSELPIFFPILFCVTSCSPHLIWTLLRHRGAPHRQCEGLSGRSLRKVPFLAHAMFVQVSRTLSLFLIGNEELA